MNDGVTDEREFITTGREGKSMALTADQMERLVSLGASVEVMIEVARIVEEVEDSFASVTDTLRVTDRNETVTQSVTDRNNEAAARRMKAYRARIKANKTDGLEACEAAISETVTDRNNGVTVTRNETVTVTDSYAMGGRGDSILPSLSSSSSEEKKEKIGVTREAIGPASRETVRDAVDAWNFFAVNHKLAKVSALTDERINKLRMRLRDCGGMGGWEDVLRAAGRSPGLLGKNDRKWRMSFDWLLKPANFIKIREGTYDDWKSNNQSVLMDAFERIRAEDASRGVGGDFGEGGRSGPSDAAYSDDGLFNHCGGNRPASGPIIEHE